MCSLEIAEFLLISVDLSSFCFDYLYSVGAQRGSRALLPFSGGHICLFYGLGCSHSSKWGKTNFLGRFLWGPKTEKTQFIRVSQGNLKYAHLSNAVRNATHTQSPQNLTSLMSIGKNIKKNWKFWKNKFSGGHLLAKYGKNRLKFDFS